MSNTAIVAANVSTSWTTILTSVTAITSMVSAVASAYALRTSAKSDRLRMQSSNLNRLIQAVIHCNQRYHDLESEIRRLPQSSLEDDNVYRHYMIRYWSLKSDQFDYWIAGFIDPDAFTTWFSSVAKHFCNETGHYGNMTFSSGWSQGKLYHKSLNPWFIRFIDAIKEAYPAGTAPDNDYGKLRDIIVEMEGTSRNPGPTAQFRKVFQTGMTYEQYIEWNKRSKDVLEERLGRNYKEDKL